MQLLCCYIKRYATKLMRFIQLKCVRPTVGLLRPVRLSQTSVGPGYGIYFNQACLCRVM